MAVFLVVCSSSPITPRIYSDILAVSQLASPSLPPRPPLGDADTREFVSGDAGKVYVTFLNYIFRLLNKLVCFFGLALGEIATALYAFTIFLIG